MRRRLRNIGVPGWALLATVFPAFDVGFAYALGDPIRTASPTFETAKSVAPMWAWGVLFLLVGVATLVSMLFDHAGALAFSLGTAGMVWSWWAITSAISIVTQPAASLSAPGIYAFIAFVCYVIAYLTWLVKR